MNQEEDEDAFLYGDPAQATTATKSSVSSGPGTLDQEMEPASEEGEVDDDEEEEEDSVNSRSRKSLTDLGHRNRYRDRTGKTSCTTTVYL
jgi:hypothetical protein